MINILASGIILHGNASGVWSPSHPDLYPNLTEIPLTVFPSVPQIEERYIPETPMTDGYGIPIFPHKL